MLKSHPVDLTYRAVVVTQCQGAHFDASRVCHRKGQLGKALPPELQRETPSSILSFTMKCGCESLRKTFRGVSDEIVCAFAFIDGSRDARLNAECVQQLREHLLVSVTMDEARTAEVCSRMTMRRLTSPNPCAGGVRPAMLLLGGS